jgi:CRISPR-associated endoribonuclease Cas6
VNGTPLELRWYRARLRTLTAVAFRDFSGPALRGGLGEDRDLYARLLSPAPALPQKRFADAPRPLLLRPRFGAGVYGEDSALELDLTLVGSAVAHMPALVRALARLGARGVGEGHHGGQGRFELERVDALGPDRAREPVVTPAGMFRPVSLPWSYPHDFAPASGLLRHGLRLQFATPTFINAHGLSRGSLEFGDLVADVLRRLSLLSQAYGDGPVHTRQEECALQARARTVLMADHALRWVEVPSYSRKQKQARDFGGWMGWVEYEADPAEWQPLLRLARLLHVGKHTAFGFGAVRPANPGRVRGDDLSGPGPVRLRSAAGHDARETTMSLRAEA